MLLTTLGREPERRDVIDGIATPVVVLGIPHLAQQVEQGITAGPLRLANGDDVTDAAVIVVRCVV